MTTKLKHKALFVLIVLIGFAVSSCKDDEDTITEPTVKEEQKSETLKMLQAHAWRFDKTFYQVKQGSHNYYNVPDCFLDDTLSYLNDDLYLKNSGKVLCPNQNQYDSLTYKLTDDEKQIELNNKGVDVVKDILILNDDSLALQSVNPDNDTSVFIYLKIP